MSCSLAPQLRTAIRSQRSAQLTRPDALQRVRKRYRLAMQLRSRFGRHDVATHPFSSRASMS